MHNDWEPVWTNGVLHSCIGLSDGPILKVTGKFEKII